jgi:hypothetical protein
MGIFGDAWFKGRFAGPKTDDLSIGTVTSVTSQK